MIPKLYDLIDHAINTVGQESIQIIWSFQNAVRVNKPYITLNYTADDLPDHEWYSNKVDYRGFRTMSSWRKAVVDLQVYAAHDSLRLANKLSQLLATEASLEQQQRLDVSIGNRLMLQRIPALLNNSQYEDRAIYHFDFYYTENFDEDVGFIATVVIEGDYSGSLTNVTCEETITVPYIDQDLPHLQITIWDDLTTSWDGRTTLWE
jgi:hypothetical protein